MAAEQTNGEFPWTKHIGSVQSAIEKGNDILAEGVLNVLLDVAVQVPVDLSVRIALMARLGCLEQRKGNTQAALKNFNEGMQLAADNGLSEDSSVAACLDGLADVHQADGDFDAAQECRRKSVVIAEATLGGEHPQTAYLRERLHKLRSERDLAMLGRDVKTLFDLLAEQLQSGFVEAEPTNIEDRTDENVAGYLWDKYIANGQKELLQKNLRDAEGAFRSAVERSQHFKADDPRRCESLRLLAHVLEEMGKGDEACSCYEKALIVAFRQIGPNSAESARCMEMLGDLFNRKDEFALAKNYYVQAGNAYILSLGRQHPDVLSTQEKLNGLLSKVKEENKWTGWSA